MKQLKGFFAGIAIAITFAATAATVYNYFPPPGMSYGPTTGLVLGAPTGGAQGANTLNATGLFVNGVSVATGGTVTSVGLTVPSWETVSGSPVTGSGTLAVSAAGGQTANSVLASPNGSSGALSVRALVGADIPPINLGSTANGGILSTSILPGANGGTGNGFTAFSGPSASLKTFGLPNVSANILTDNAAVTVAQGGTGVGTLTGILQGNGTSAITGITNSSTTGQTLRVTGASTYAWGALDVSNSNAVVNIMAAANGGTGNGFTAFSGPATTTKTFTLPNASATILTTNAAVTVAQGGTGLATLTAHGVLLGEGTSNIGNVAAMALDTLLQGQGTGNDPAAITINNCGSSTTALSYSTSTHTFGCQTISAGTGTVTSVAAGTGITASPSPIVSTGTISVDQTFSPTWTGNHSFSPTSGVPITITPPASGGPNGINIVMGTSIAGRGINITNTSSSASALSSIFMSNNTPSTFEQGVTSTAASAFFTGSPSGAQIFFGAAGAVPITIGTNGIERMNIAGSGAVTIDAPTSGTALSVNALSGNNGIFLKGGDTSNATTALLVQNSATTNLFYVTDSGSTIAAGFFYNSGIALQTSASTGAVCVNTGTSPAGQFTYNNSSTCTVSSLRFKKDIAPLDAGLDEVMNMHPVSYNLKQDTLHAGRQVGLIAEDIAKLDPRLAFNDNDGKPLGVRYEQLTAVLVHAIQQQQKEIDTLKKRKHH